MEITQAFVDALVPEHGRTSCTDTTRTNGYYSIVEEKVSGVVTHRDWNVHPRCNRCFLLDHIGQTLDSRILLRSEVSLTLRQPEYKIEQVSL